MWRQRTLFQSPSVDLPRTTFVGKTASGVGTAGAAATAGPAGVAAGTSSSSSSSSRMGLACFLRDITSTQFTVTVPKKF